jgi:hypothetical protein
MYREDANKICTRDKKSVVTFLEEEVSSILLSILCRFLFFGNLCFVFLYPFLYLGTLILVVTVLLTVEAFYF